MTISEYTAIAVPVPVCEDGSGAAVALSPEATARPCLEVEAPATLTEGYAFDAQFNGQTFAVTVPAGGVKEGQRFIVPHPAAAGSSDAAPPRSSIPVGQWKDGMCDCCRFGCCHPACCNAYVCPLVLLGQIMTRLKLTWSASEGTVAQTKLTFRIMASLTVGWYLLQTLAHLSTVLIGPIGQYFSFVGPIGKYFSFVFVVVLVSRTRRRIRQRYRIPEGSCGDCDDCCAAWWCTYCTIAQMARHTADYDTYAGRCCSEMGLPSHAPALDDMSPAASSIV